MAPRSSQPKATLSPENQVLMALHYWRNHLTYREVASSWDLGESAVSKLIREVKTHMTNSNQFRVITQAETKANPGLVIMALQSE
ncbi:transposase family protein [Synechococcus sp. PCC 6312]|uniref:helix-turn-helix domain-containing protein n=1 Tax=Synechococcus sp. (strain ATCC 27167 / PCC 6312) TaxID=195253 RepID=UPI002110D265|nr:transposase family protein [Synechococcus sp. PCC 6312]